MEIFTEEQSLASLITEDKVVGFCLPMTITSEKTDLLVTNLSKVKDLNAEVVAKLSDKQHPDLMYGEAILASTCMNKNDDVFLPEDTWEAKDTPVNTPFNNEHDQVDIIGHIFASMPLDSNGKELKASTPPDYFDLAVSFVAYESIFPKVIGEIKKLAPEGKKFVSMECRFGNFDYALFDESKEAKIVKRNEATAFLTKYLRAYGGDGKYGNYRIGRVLRKFRFTGMGNVNNPANPASEYIKLNDNSFVYTNDVEKENSSTKGNIMTNETLEQAQKTIAELTTKVQTLEAELANKKTETLEAQISTLTNEKKELTEKLQAVEAKVQVADQKIAEANTTITDLNKKIDTITTDLKAKTEIIEKAEKEAKTKARLQQLIDSKIEVTDDLKAKVAVMNDEQYDSVLLVAKSLKVQPEKTEKTETKDESTKATETEKKAEETLATEKKEEKAAIETTKGDDKPDTNKIQETAAKMVEFVRKQNKNAAKSKNNK